MSSFRPIFERNVTAPNFLWDYGKPPDAVIELISDLRSEELGSKLSLRTTRPNNHALLSVGRAPPLPRQSALGGAWRTMMPGTAGGSSSPR
jgi:hypothetical protein